MNEWGYVIAGWVTVVAGLGGYATWVLMRGRRLSAQVAPDRRRWMES